MRSVIMVKAGAPAIPRYQFFIPSNVPANLGSTGSSGINTATAFYVTAPCNAVALRFYKNSSDTSPNHTVVLWDIATAANLGQAVSSGEPASGWVEVALSSPVALVPAHPYFASSYSSAGYYAYTNSYLVSTPYLIKGPLIAYPSGQVPVFSGNSSLNGAYLLINNVAFPTNGFDANYWADVVVESTAVNIGSMTTGASSGTFTGITAVKINLAQSGTLQSISMFFTNNPGSVTYLLGLYSDASGLPGTRLASSAVSSSPVPGLNTLPIASGPTLSPGDYWLAIQSQNPVDGFFNTPAGAGAWNNAVGWTGSLPTTFPSPNSGPYQYSLFATFT